LEQARALLSYVLRLRLAAGGAYAGGRRYRYALWALQSIGEGYALLSEPWPILGGDAPAVPLADRLSASLEANGVFEWALSYGYRLAPWQGLPLKGVPPAATTTEEEIAETVSTGLTTYGRFLHNLSDAPGLAFLARRGVDLRRFVVARLSPLRLLHDWHLDHGSGDAPRAALALMSNLTDAEFVALAGPPEELGSAPVFSFEAVGDYLKETGVRDWLDQQGRWPIPRS
jgi:hypothetical protein